MIGNKSCTHWHNFIDRLINISKESLISERVIHKIIKLHIETIFNMQFYDPFNAGSAPPTARRGDLAALLARGITLKEGVSYGYGKTSANS